MAKEKRKSFDEGVVKITIEVGGEKRSQWISHVYTEAEVKRAIMELDKAILEGSLWNDLTGRE